jgi:hypothetical protein
MEVRRRQLSLRRTRAKVSLLVAQYNDVALGAEGVAKLVGLNHLHVH